jgi:hypothetical protein
MANSVERRLEKLAALFWMPKPQPRSWLAEFDRSAYMAQHNYIRPSSWTVISHVASVAIRLL